MHFALIYAASVLGVLAFGFVYWKVADRIGNLLTLAVSLLILFVVGIAFIGHGGV